jgi:hypothetical protein
MNFKSLQRVKSRVFGSSSSASLSSASSSSTQMTPSGFRNNSGPPPMPPMPAMTPNSGIRIEPAAPRPTKKVQKAPVQVTHVTNEMIRELRELIRYRYALDCKIWDIGRKVKWFQRETVLIDMQRSDAALVTIRTTLEGWDRREYFATLEEYNRFKEIRNRILDANTRTWAKNPPWKQDEVETNNGPQEKDGRPIQYIRVSMAQPYSNGCIQDHGYSN